MKTYNVCVKRHHQIYKFRIVATGVAQALKQLKSYIDLTNRDYKLRYIMEAQ